MTYIIPARYFVSTLQSLFLAGNIPVVLIVNTLFLIASAVIFIGLTWMANVVGLTLALVCVPVACCLSGRRALSVGKVTRYPL